MLVIVYITDGVVAHAYNPPNGDIHFNDAEKWVVGNKHGINLVTVAAHEIGHSIGLRDSDVPEALMYGLFKTDDSEVRFHRDDLAAIQRLYGEDMYFRFTELVLRFFFLGKHIFQINV